jgi:hypothetical protein
MTNARSKALDQDARVRPGAFGTVPSYPRTNWPAPRQALPRGRHIARPRWFSIGSVRQLGTIANLLAPGLDDLPTAGMGLSAVWMGRSFHVRSIARACPMPAR